MCPWTTGVIVAENEPLYYLGKCALKFKSSGLTHRIFHSFICNKIKILSIRNAQLKFKYHKVVLKYGTQVTFHPYWKDP